VCLMPKLCGKCQTEKDESSFHKRKMPSGNYTLQPWCKDCAKSNQRAWNKKKREEDPEWRDEQNKKAAEYRKNNPEFVKRVTKRNREVSRKHYQTNKADYMAKDAERRARKVKATPKWLSKSDREHIKRIYRVRQKVSDKTGVEHHVDHIVPLKGDSICGLHVPWNLAIIPAKMNLSKGNKHEQF